jgi:hypothetical protein
VRTGRRGWGAALLALISSGALLSACDPLPGRLRTDPPGTAFNATTSRWRVYSSTGAYGVTRQVSTGVNRFAFTETWFAGKQKLATIGTASYEPANQINIYQYSKPPGVVVVRTREGHEELMTEDVVLASTLPQFQVGEKLTYTLRP